MPLAENAWTSLPREMVPRMRSELDDLTEETVREIQRNIPEIAVRIEARDDRTVRLGVAWALTEFVDRVADPGTTTRLNAQTVELYRALGRDRMLEGLGLDGLQAAYRLGARLAWRRWVDLGRQAGIPATRMYQLAEAVLVYTDELATRTVEGYRQAQTGADTERLKYRRQLLEFLLATPEGPPGTLMELSRSARWPLPESVVAVALRPPLHSEGRMPAPLLRGDNALIDTDRPDPCMLLPADQPNPLPALEHDLRGWRAATGPSVPLAEAFTSVRWAWRLLDLAQHGLGEGRRIVHCDDHLSTLILLEDEALIRKLSAHRLAPLAKLTPKQRDRLAETLLTWLKCGGSAPEVARRMQVHPQTVRYRLRQLEDLFGRALRDPDARFDLEIVLRARVLLDRISARDLRA